MARREVQLYLVPLSGDSTSINALLTLELHTQLHPHLIRTPAQQPRFNTRSCTHLTLAEHALRGLLGLCHRCSVLVLW